MAKKKITIKNDVVTEGITEGILKNMRVRLNGIGFFEVKEIKNRKYFNPYTRKVEQKAVFRKIKFTPSTTLKNKLNND